MSLVSTYSLEFCDATKISFRVETDRLLKVLRGTMEEGLRRGNQEGEDWGGRSAEGALTGWLRAIKDNQLVTGASSLGEQAQQGSTVGRQGPYKPKDKEGLCNSRYKPLPPTFGTRTMYCLIVHSLPAQRSPESGSQLLSPVFPTLSVCQIGAFVQYVIDLSCLSTYMESIGPNLLEYPATSRKPARTISESLEDARMDSMIAIYSQKSPSETLNPVIFGFSWASSSSTLRAADCCPDRVGST